MALYLIIQVGAFLSRLVPRRLRYLIGTGVGDLLYAAWFAKRRHIRQNMAVVLGLDPDHPAVRRAALKSVRNYAKYLVEFLALPALSPRDEVVRTMSVRGLEHLVQALERGKGVILASAHVGTTEIGGLRLAEYGPVHAVYDSFRPAYLDRLIRRRREEKGIRLISVREVGAMLRVLRGGGLLTLLFDRPLRRDEGVHVRFFGRETAVPGGPAVLALKTGAAIVPAYIFRRPDLTFEGVLFPPILPVPSDDRQRDVQAIMQKLTDTLQAVVRERPDQWYMFRPMWPDDPSSWRAGRPEAMPSGSA